MGDETEQSGYECPYPNCDWSPSRPVETDIGLTNAVVEREIESHRHAHKATGPEGLRL